jgi:hypothetical protein
MIERWRVEGLRHFPNVIILRCSCAVSLLFSGIATVQGLREWGGGGYPEHVVAIPLTVFYVVCMPQLLENVFEQILGPWFTK